jgi:DNA-binding MarR family transcriptional regulator
MSSDPAVPYADSLSFLLSQVGAHSAQRFAQRLKPLGVSPRGFGVLGNLAATSSQTQQQLADALEIHRNNMVGLIDDLEAAGWVRRHRSTTDRRAFDVRLTRSGRATVTRVTRLIPALDQELGQDLSDTEQVTLVALLQRLADTHERSRGVHPRLAS